MQLLTQIITSQSSSLPLPTLQGCPSLGSGPLKIRKTDRQTDRQIDRQKERRKEGEKKHVEKGRKKYVIYIENMYFFLSVFSVFFLPLIYIYIYIYTGRAVF